MTSTSAPAPSTPASALPHPRYSTVEVRVTEPVTAARMDDIAERITSAAAESPSGKTRLLVHFATDALVNLREVPAIVSDKFDLLGKVEKYAVVTDRTWIRAAASISDALPFGMRAKAFASADLPEAVEWLHEPLPDEVVTLFAIADAPEGVLAYRLEGLLTAADYALLDSKLDGRDLNSADLLLEVEEFDGVTFEAFLADFKLGFEHYNTLRRVAVVTDLKIGLLISGANAITPGLEERHFKLDERYAAYRWLSAPVQD